MRTDRRGFLGALLVAPLAPKLAEASTLSTAGEDWAGWKASCVRWAERGADFREDPVRRCSLCGDELLFGDRHIQEWVRTGDGHVWTCVWFPPA